MVECKCPHCHQNLSLKITKPGRFAPQCPWCHQKLLITVPSDPAGVVKVERMPAEGVPPVEHPKEVVKPPALPTAGVPSAGTPPTGSLKEEVVKPTLGRSEQTEATQDFTKVESPVPQPSSGGSVVAKTRADASGATEVTGAWKPPAAAADAEADSTRTQSTAAPSAAAEVRTTGAALDIPEILGGYRVLQRLGQGAMGAVYLAKQLSLNRSVALKTIRPEVAQNPVAVARFTREAYAAAQLVHHNVVQIYDMAADRGVNFFSMEFVNGQNLSDLVRRRGKLPVQEATGLVLQAARGLGYAHLNGMVHRDVKPANLMLNDQGIVKVADLGLVKVSAEPAAPAEAKGSGGVAAATPLETGPVTSEVTLARTTMGTAAYIAPEQITDAHNVDHRADIYSLGCTFFVLLTGRAPFEGGTVLEVIRRHQREPIPRPDDVDPDVPAELGDIVAKMTAKKPQDRYANLEEVIKSLEAFLARGDGGTLRPRAEHLRDLTLGLEEFNGAPWRKIRRLAGPLFLALSVLLFLLTVWTGRWGLAGGMAAYALATFGSYVFLRGVLEEDYLYNRLRALVLQSRLSDRVVWGVGVFLLVMVILLLGLLTSFIFAVVLGVGTAVTFYFVVDRLLAAQRLDALDRVRRVLMELRARGMEEEQIRKLVTDQCSGDWEEFVESLFDYETKLAVRRQRDEADESAGRRFGRWRDPIIRWADRRLERQQKQREREHLLALEEKRLESEGVGKDEAHRRASIAANTLVSQAMELRELMATAGPGDRNVAKRQQELLRNLVKAAQTGNVTERERSRLAPVEGTVGLLFGQGLRFLLGCGMLAMCAWWLQTNNLLPSSVDEVKKQVGVQDINDSQALTQRYMPAFGATAKEAVHQKNMKGLPIPFLPDRLVRGLNGVTLVAGGLILLVGSLMMGRWVGPFVFAAAAVALFGSALGLPILISLRGYDVTAALVGFGVLVGGWVLGGEPAS